MRSIIKKKKEEECSVFSQVSDRNVFYAPATLFAIFQKVKKKKNRK